MCRYNASSAKPCAVMRPAERTTENARETKILFDDADLLHERLAAYRAHVFDDRLRHHPAVQADAGLRRGVDYRHGRARGQRRTVGQKSGNSGIGVRRENGGAVESALG